VEVVNDAKNLQRTVNALSVRMGVFKLGVVSMVSWLNRHRHLYLAEQNLVQGAEHSFIQILVDSQR
jgi:hypothetical protein